MNGRATLATFGEFARNGLGVPVVVMAVIAMAPDAAETTRLERPPRGREEVPVQISRLLDAHQIIIGHCRELAALADKLGDDGTNDLAVSDVLRTNELQVWFISEHLVDMPLVHAIEPDVQKAG